MKDDQNLIPAFPTLAVKDVKHGMSLRDFFAAAALTGLLAADSESAADVLAEDAYIAADEMLKARQA